jgi:putative transposase
MPRKPRIHYPGALYHAFSRGNNRNRIFLSDADYRHFLSLLQKVKSSLPYRIYAYALMPNHFHLLIEADEAPLAQIMQKTLTAYAKYFNHMHKHKGHVFQGRYRAVLCEKDSYLLELVRYIHLNPVKAKLASQVAQWPWTSHAYYVRPNPKSWVDSAAVLDYWGASGSGQKQYAQFLNDRAIAPVDKVLRLPSAAPYLGSADFQKAVQDKYRKNFEARLKLKLAKHKSLDVFLQEFLQKAQIDKKLFQGGTRMSEVAQARKKFILDAFNQGYANAEIARQLYCSGAYVSKIIVGEKS